MKIGRGAGGLSSDGATGYSLVEILLVASLSLAVGAMALPAFNDVLDRVRCEQAARHLASLIRAVRTEAVQRDTQVALVFVRDGSRWVHRRVADGNANGVRLAEVRSGTDVPVGPAGRVSDDFRGVELGVREVVPDVDGEGVVSPGADPVRTGASDLVSCSPDGGCSSGTIYLSGRDGSTWAVRVLGLTGRVRLLTYRRPRQSWVEP